MNIFTGALRGWFTSLADILPFPQTKHQLCIRMKNARALIKIYAASLQKSTKTCLVKSYFGSQGLVLRRGSWEIGEESQLEYGCYKAHAGDDIFT